jgi:hypothetical protein
MQVDQVQVVKRPTIQPPEKLEGTTGELLEIKPFAYKDEGIVKQGQDAAQVIAAQVIGDDIWQRVRFLLLGDYSLTNSDLFARRLAGYEG